MNASLIQNDSSRHLYQYLYASCLLQNTVQALLERGGSSSFAYGLGVEQFSKEDKRATTNVQNGLFLFFFSLFYSLLSLLEQNPLNLKEKSWGKFSEKL